MSWSVLVTGANRGLGLGIVKYFLNNQDSPSIVIATCRDPEKATELQELKKKNDKLHILQLEVTKFDSFPDFSKKVEAIVGKNGLNVLINNAGFALPMDKMQSINNVTPEDYLRTININTLGPIFITKALLPFIERAADLNKDKPEGLKRAAIFNMSSLGGSVSLFVLPHILAYTYRESKAALNHFTRALALECEPKGIVVVVLHPGHVQTDMGGPTATITVDESVSGMMNIFYSLDKSKNNRFIQYDGKELPW